MNRREFLHRAMLLAAGAVAVDQLELLDRLGWTRTLFAGWQAPTSAVTVDSAYGVNATFAQWDALLRDAYVSADIMRAINAESPLVSNFRRRQPRSLLAPLVWTTQIAVVSR